jgi:hypothetical protein
VADSRRKISIRIRKGSVQDLKTFGSLKSESEKYTPGLEIIDKCAVVVLDRSSRKREEIRSMRRESPRVGNLEMEMKDGGLSSVGPETIHG